MSRIQEAFKGKKAFIPFVTCGDPDLETTKQIVYEMEKAGAALIELGIPFSDPTAEGPVIQGANLRALTGGVTTDKIFDMVKEIRQNTQIPLVFMTYASNRFEKSDISLSPSSQDCKVRYGISKLLQKSLRLIPACFRKSFTVTSSRFPTTLSMSIYFFFSFIITTNFYTLCTCF